MRSTMQDAQLGVGRMIRHMARVNQRSTVICQEASRRTMTTFGVTAERAVRLASALEKRGVEAGDRVASFMAASQEHFETYLGVPYLGAVLHTVNIRLHTNDIAQICNEAEDRVFIVDEAMKDHFLKAVPLLAKPRLVVLVGAVSPEELQGTDITVVGYEALLMEGEGDFERPDVDEHQAAILCHTGGTTGLPKGVAYSHRSLWLQAMSLCTGNSLGVTAADTLLPVVPMFHVNGWGLPFAAALSGAKLILPGAALRAAVVADLISTEQPTIVAGVPTIWTDLIAFLGTKASEVLRPVRLLSTGGTFVTPTLIETFNGFGVKVVQAWGMTETSSMSTISNTPPWAETSKERMAYAAGQGRIVAGLEVRVVDPAGVSLPADGVTVGEIQIRGPWVTRSYFPHDDPDKFQDGWLRTGDLGRLDGDGFVFLSDRLKDAIKSGGEWIPSPALESAIQAKGGFREVAVIAVPDERWQERPLAVVVPATLGEQTDFSALARLLDSVIPRWWIPINWVVLDEIPRTGMGKFDKKKMRELFTDGTLGHVHTIIPGK